MDALTEFMDLVRTKNLARGHFRGFLHVLIGRRILNSRGETVAAGMTYRDVASLLKKLRWEPDEVNELAIEVDVLPPRDRQRFWFTAICKAGVDGETARAEAAAFADAIRAEGFQVSAASANGRTA